MLLSKRAIRCTQLKSLRCKVLPTRIVGRRPFRFPHFSRTITVIPSHKSPTKWQLDELIEWANTRTSDYQYCQTEPDGVRFLGYGPTMSHVVQTSLNYFLETAQSDPNPEDKLLNKKRWPLLYFHLDNMTVRSARDPVVQDYFEQLIERIPLMMFTKLEIETKLSPDDFNHGHLIAINTFPAQPPTFGMLFHLHEYPKYDKEKFPYELGVYQQRSKLEYNPQASRYKNVLWIWPANVLLCFDAWNSTIRNLFIPDYWQEFNTVDEGRIGQVLGDLYYLMNSLPYASPRCGWHFYRSKPNQGDL